MIVSEMAVSLYCTPRVSVCAFFEGLVRGGIRLNGQTNCLARTESLESRVPGVAVGTESRLETRKIDSLSRARQRSGLSRRAGAQGAARRLKGGAQGAVFYQA